MKTSNLHPELVGKLGNVILGETARGNDWLLKDGEEVLQQCAKIAVEYAEEKIVFAVAELAQEITVLKQQRYELLEALKETSNHYK